MTVKLLTEHHLELQSLKGGCKGSSESTLVKCHIVGNHILLCAIEQDMIICLGFNIEANHCYSRCSSVSSYKILVLARAFADCIHKVGT